MPKIRVIVAKVGQRRAIAGVELGVGARDLESGRAALPDAHQPDGVDRQRGERVPLLSRHLVERQRMIAARVATQPPQPDGRVDLVDGRASGQ